MNDQVQKHTPNTRFGDVVYQLSAKANELNGDDANDFMKLPSGLQTIKRTQYKSEEVKISPIKEQ